MNCSMPGFPVHHQLPELAQTHVHWVDDTIQPSHPLSSHSPAFNLSSSRVFSRDSVLPIRWPKYWSFSFSISPSNEYSGLVSFRIDWFDLLAVQETLKSLLQHHSSKTSILRHSAFFIVPRSIYSFFIVKDLSEPFRSWCASWNLLVLSGAFLSYLNTELCDLQPVHFPLSILDLWETVSESLANCKSFLLQMGQRRPRPYWLLICILTLIT